MRAFPKTIQNQIEIHKMKKISFILHANVYVLQK